MAKYITCHRRGSAADWAKLSTLIPLEGEIVIEIDEVNALHKLKIGDGKHTYAELAYLMAGDEIVTQVLTQAKPRVVTIELAETWNQDAEGKYSQILTLNNITAHSRLDLQPTADMIAEFKQLGLVFVTENNGGVITVYSVGNTPSQSYTMQATIVETECDGEDELVVGIPVGTPVAQSDWTQTDETKADYIKNKPTILTDEDIENIIEESGGATFVPSVSNDGILSWTNDKGLKNPTPVNVVGPKGDAYTLTKADMGEIIEYMAQGLIPISDGDNIHALELDKEYKLKGNIGQFTNPTAYLDIMADVESDRAVVFQNPFKFQNRYDETVTSPTLKVSVTQGEGVYNIVLEYCGKTYTHTYTPSSNDEFFVITNISLCFLGQVYLVDSTIIPKYEVTDEVKTEITNMVLNEMERAEDWVL